MASIVIMKSSASHCHDPRRKQNASLVELIDLGEQEDVDLLYNCLENKGMLSSFQVVLPERYSSEQRMRCHGWLRDLLQFEEECKGNIVVYKHKTWKVNTVTLLSLNVQVVVLDDVLLYGP